MIKGRRTSPDTVVGSFDNEATSTSGDDTPEEETVVPRRRGGGGGLSLDEDGLLSDGCEASASGEDGNSPVKEETGGGTVDISGMVTVSDGGAWICAE